MRQTLRSSASQAVRRSMDYTSACAIGCSLPRLRDKTEFIGNGALGGAGHAAVETGSLREYSESLGKERDRAVALRECGVHGLLCGLHVVHGVLRKHLEKACCNFSAARFFHLFKFFLCVMKKFFNGRNFSFMWNFSLRLDFS